MLLLGIIGDTGNIKILKLKKESIREGEIQKTIISRYLTWILGNKLYIWISAFHAYSESALVG